MNYRGSEIKSLVNVNDETNIADMQLFGDIGNDVNGNIFAQDIISMSQFGFDEVRININSVGGSVFQGFSILNAINVLRSNGTKISTRLVGVADSMAGVILAFGDKGSRTASNSSSGVVHEPLFRDSSTGELISLQDLPEGDLKDEATFMMSSLLDSLESSTGSSRKELSDVMKEGTRRTAKELKSLGFIDEVVKLSNEVKIDINNKTAVELMAAYTGVLDFNNKKTVKKMELVNKSLKLDSQAIENEAVKAIETLQNKVSESKTTIDTQATEIETLKNEKKALETKVADAEAQKIEAFVNSQIELGKFPEDKKDELVNQAKTNFDAFKVIAESISEGVVNVNNKIAGASGEAPKGDEKLLNQAKEYHTADVEGTLEAFKNKVGEAKFTEIENYRNENFEKLNVE